MSRVVGFAVFIGIALTIIAGLHYYVYARVVRDVGLPREWRLGLSLGLVVAGVSLPAAVMVSRILMPPWRALAVWPAFLWMGFMFLLFVTLSFGDVTRLLATLVAKLAFAVDLAEPARRLFLSRVLGGGAVVVALGLSGVAVASAVTAPAVKRVRVALKRLPQALDGLVVVQISDLHVGETMRRGYVEEVVRRTNALNPDVVVITGDLVDGGVDELERDVAPIAGLKARYGVFFVTGNHEYYAGVDEWLPHLAAMGIRVLRNERVTIGEGEALLDIAGVDDTGSRHAMMPPGHGADVPKAMAGADPKREVILLAHQPKEVAAAVLWDVGLVLAGHTHGGQIWPFGYLVRLTQPYLDGLHLHAGKTFVYVSRGTGYWGPPMRLAEPAEITRVELRVAGESVVE